MAGAASLVACTSGTAAQIGSTTGSATSSPSVDGSARTSATSPAAGATTTATTGPAPAPTGPALPAFTPWSPDANDVDPAVKLAAVQVVEALLTHPASGAGATAARQRLAALGQDPGLVDAALGLIGTTGASVAEVVDVQYGGILATSSSVLVVMRVRTQAPDGTITQGGTTVDVRLVSASPRWRVTELHPAVPGPAVSPLSAPARQVLASGRITLPPASSADVLSGQVHDSVLQALLTLSASHTIGVSVVRSGHPTYVFGTGRLSDHPRGRAFDTWQIDGHAVVSSATPRSLVVSYMEAAAAAGSYNVGGPYLLPGSTYFSDATHHDHVHAGFRT